MAKRCNNASIILALLRRVHAPIMSPFTGHVLTRRPIGELTLLHADIMLRTTRKVLPQNLARTELTAVGAAF